MIGFLSFLVGLLLGVLVTIVLAGIGFISIIVGDLKEAEETIKTCNELLESVVNHEIEVKVES